MLSHHVALVSEDSAITAQELTAVAAALQKQVSRDFGPIWGIYADVSAFLSLEEVPLDYWPIIIQDTLDDPSAAGYHEDKHGQPYSLVLYEKDWPLTASHELLEMLADPYGRHMIAGKSPSPKQGRVRFLVEVCDPCEDASFAYTINGITVSDFYTPHFFDPVASSSVRYSYQGALKAPRDVLKGGYLSWYDPASRSWWQRTWFSGSRPVDRNLSSMNAKGGNARAAIDRITQAERARVMKIKKGQTVAGASTSEESARAFQNRAEDLRANIRQASRKRK